MWTNYLRIQLLWRSHVVHSTVQQVIKKWKGRERLRNVPKLKTLVYWVQNYIVNFQTFTLLSCLPNLPGLMQFRDFLARRTTRKAAVDQNTDEKQFRLITMISMKKNSAAKGVERGNTAILDCKLVFFCFVVNNSQFCNWSCHYYNNTELKSNDVVQNSTGVVLLQKEFKPFLNTLRRREIELNCDIFLFFSFAQKWKREEALRRKTNKTGTRIFFPF